MAPTLAKKTGDPEKINGNKKKKKNMSEIDEIFEMKRAKRRVEAEDPTAKKMDSKVNKNHNKSKPYDQSESKNKKKDKKRSREEEMVAGGGGSGNSTKRRRRTSDGLAVYSAEELGVGSADAGGTPLCPFDCSCCF